MHHFNKQPSVAGRPSLTAAGPLRLLIAAALALGLPGCGQKGPLTLPPVASSASAPSALR